MKYESGQKRIQELLEAIRGTDIEEIHYKKNGLNIGLKKKFISPDVSPGDKKKKIDDNKEMFQIVSHSVGIFRDAHPPSRKLLAKVGDTINKGQRLGYIESMKIMKEIVSTVKGRITAKHVKSGSPVEYGQKLFEIEIV
ncbi:MAG: biotin/lipoyl-containing protein [Elusimicrobiota bacterium]